MIGRLLGGGLTLLVYFCTATLIAECLFAGWLCSAWHLDRTRLAQVVAVLQGGPLPSAAAETTTQAKPPETPSEQPSYQEILDRRAVKVRDLELRELSLHGALDQLKAQKRQLAEGEKRLQEQTTQFAAQVASVKEGAEASGRELVVRTLQSMKPKQAKEQLSQMLESNQIDQVVLLLPALPDTNRAKILAEFKTPDENKKLAEVLRLIRQGQPEASIADKAQQQFSQAKPSGS
jgi:flagellar motility protein MotE (MotC chaperone)